MTQKQFLNLLERYRQGSCSPEEEKIVDEWFAGIRHDRYFSLDSGSEESLKSKSWDTVNAHIQSGKQAAERQGNRKTRTILWPALGIAAAILLVAVSYIFMHQETKSSVEIASPVVVSKSELTFIKNELSTNKLVTLPEGTMITLSPGGSLKFLPVFDHPTREVFLEGEAFFQVARDVSRPFLVYTNEVTTKVLGTSFTIKALRDDKNITVAVKTGKVSVYTERKKMSQDSKHIETILMPNQQIVYNRKENKVSRMLVTEPKAIMSAEEIRRMRFEEVSVIEIFAALEKIYGIDIDFDEKLLSACTLTTSISDETIFNRLDIICKAIGATYAVEETQVVITGTGCN